MDSLFRHLMSNIVGYMEYKKEHDYMTRRWGCKKTTNELCLQLRTYQRTILPQPRIEDLIRSCYHPCDRTCPYYIKQEDAFPLLIYSVVEYGKIVECKSLYAIALFRIMEARDPTELELVLFEQTMNIPESQSNEPQKVSPSLQLQPYTLTKSLEDRCCICQDQMTSGQEVVTLPCFHTFHIHFQTRDNECMGIESWLRKSNECPLCKQSVR